MTTEIRKLRMHEALLKSVIREQAGSLWKGILEGVQNSVDAGASRIDIRLEADRVEIHDDGRGFQTDREVEEYFETFGTPHEEGDAVFGRFRVGRGQLFNYGITVYRTGTYQFEVDIEKRGQDYALTRDLPPVRGCHVTLRLYEPLLASELHAAEQNLRKAVKYLSTTVTLNDQPISTDPKTLKWDAEDEDAYYRLDDTQSLKIYHLGCYITDLPAARLGSGGVVVAKKHLTVNMARNAIDERCPIWRRIRKHFQARSTEQNLRRPALDDAGRQNLIDQLLAGEITLDELSKRRLLRDATGSLVTLARICTRNAVPVAFAPTGDRSADRAIAAGAAMVLSESVLEMFHVDTPEQWQAVVERIVERQGGAWYRPPVLVDMQVLRERYTSDFTPIEPKRWRPVEKAWMDAISMADRATAGWYREVGYGHELPDGEKVALRRIQLGESGSADAWTDGHSTIFFNRHFLAGLKARNLADCVKVAQLLIHEYCHAENSAGQRHLHDVDFYRNYHDAHQLIARLAEKLLGALATTTVRGRKNTTTAMRRVQDRQQVVAREIADLEQQTEQLEAANRELEARLAQRKAARRRRTEARQRRRTLERRLETV